MEENRKMKCSIMTYVFQISHAKHKILYKINANERIYKFANIFTNTSFLPITLCIKLIYLAEIIVIKKAGIRGKSIKNSFQNKYMTNWLISTKRITKKLFQNQVYLNEVKYQLCID